MKELNYKEARKLILQGKKVARNFNLKVYVYFKDGQLVREEDCGRGRTHIRKVYDIGISELDELFKSNEENNNYRFVEVD